MLEFVDGDAVRYKVTRRMPSMNVSETKIFCSKYLAKKQFEKWLAEYR